MSHVPPEIEPARQSKARKKEPGRSPDASPDAKLSEEQIGDWIVPLSTLACDIAGVCPCRLLTWDAVSTNAATQSAGIRIMTSAYFTRLDCTFPLLRTPCVVLTTRPATLILIVIVSLPTPGSPLSSANASNVAATPFHVPRPVSVTPSTTALPPGTTPWLFLKTTDVITCDSKTSDSASRSTRSDSEPFSPRTIVSRASNPK